MDYNYHTHTYRCHHASGSVEEYINRAIENGIKFMGFSDHVPYICSNGEESWYRVPVSEAEEYVKEISALREKYKDEIDIKIGFEMEFYPEFFDKMLKNAIDFGGEYLILGEHFLEEELPDPAEKHMFRERDSIDDLKIYVNRVVSAMKTGVFTYVAHPDIINFTRDEKLFEEAIREICVSSSKYNVPLEMNFLGIRDNRFYPNEKFWKIAGEEKSPVTFGFDAHDAKSAYDGESLVKAKELVKKFNLNYIGKPEIVDIRKAVK